MTLPVSGLSVCALFLVAEEALANGVASKSSAKDSAILKVKKLIDKTWTASARYPDALRRHASD